jgi:hypothetical protein
MHRSVLPRLMTVITIAAWLAVAATPAVGAPIVYTVTFDASDAAAGATGVSGTGSFEYDLTTSTMSYFQWDFGSGRTGSLTQFALSIFGPFLYESIFFNAGDPTSGGSGGSGSAGSTVNGFPDIQVEWCWGTASGSCGMDNNGVASYQYADTQGTFQGYLTASPAAVPEPVSLLLFGTAFAVRSVIRRRG